MLQDMQVGERMKISHRISHMLMSECGVCLARHEDVMLSIIVKLNTSRHASCT